MKNRIFTRYSQLLGRKSCEARLDANALHISHPTRKLMQSDWTVLRKLIVAAVGKRPAPRGCFKMLLGVAMLCATAMAARSNEANPSGRQVVKPASGNPAGAACATCHKEVVKDFANNPHSRPALVDSGKSVTCESCHGPGKAHAESGEVTMIFDPTTATAKEVDQKCRACHDSRRTNFERSAHGEDNVSCIGCHTIHAPGTLKHLLKMDQPQLCFQCHSDVKPQFSMTFRHEVEGGLIECTDCHDEHGSFGENTLPSPRWQFMVCTKCHAATAGPFVYEHAAVKAEGCTACHFPHGGPNPELLVQANVTTVCLQCHLPSFNPDPGLPAVPAHIQLALGQTCITCHSSIHGSNTSKVFLSSSRRSGDR